MMPTYRRARALGRQRARRADFAYSPGWHPSTDTPSDGLWFKLPDGIRTHTKKIFAHYFGPYPISLENAAAETGTGYHTAFNNPAYATYKAYGSMFRDRPMYRAPLSGDYVTQDCTTDIQRAVDAGIDGFCPDLLGLSGSSYDRYEALRAAAVAWNAAHPTEQPFYVMPMVDANGSTAAASAQTAAAYVKRFCIGTGSSGTTPLSSAYFEPTTGKYVVSAFKAEGKTATYWQDLIGYLASDWGITATFMPCYNAISSSSGYTAVPQYGCGPWGYGADPAVTTAAADYAPTARARGEVFFAPICPQDIRPANSLFDEALNTAQLRAAWGKAITQDAEYAQLVTWSDFSETPSAPSAAHGFCVLDLSAWYLTKWKTGSYPAVLRDGIILSHRARTNGATITSADETSPMVHWSRGGMSAVTYNIEVVTFLTASATINVTIGGSNHSYTAPAGMNVQTYPVTGAVAANGVSAEVVRSGVQTAQVTSPVAIRSSALNDDYGYYWFSSLRGTTGQFDPSTLY